MVTEDDIDLEQLQAQIDMSMSFAHNLVTSWIKPSHKAQIPSSGMNISQIIEEELRRPPRLGVGAPIPTAPPNAYEASKLKGKLVRNGAKNESVMELRPQESSKSDDDELKGRPTKRKTKVDPFGQEGSKKKRKINLEAAPQLPIQKRSTDSVSLEMDGGSEAMPKLTVTPSRKEKQRIDPRSQTPNGSARRGSLVSSPPEALLTAPVLGKATSPEASRVRTDSIRIPDKATAFNPPLLNLDGPPGLSDKPDTPSNPNNTKKKRKRRKKKKAHIFTGSGDTH